MRLVQGSDEYKNFIDAMYHEFSLCEQAFDTFFILAGRNIVQGDNEYTVRENLYKTYSSFIVHLYEFYHACFKREQQKTDSIPHDKLDQLMTSEVEKLMNNMSNLIINGKAPSWVNDLSYYQEPVPIDFGKKFRDVRNNASHVDFRRIGNGNRPSLKEFKDSYHKFLFFLFDSARATWSSKQRELYRVNHIIEFDFSSNG